MSISDHYDDYHENISNYFKDSKPYLVGNYDIKDNLEREKRNRDFESQQMEKYHKDVSKYSELIKETELMKSLKYDDAFIQQLINEWRQVAVGPPTPIPPVGDDDDGPLSEDDAFLYRLGIE